MAKATLFLAKKANKSGEHAILVRFDVSRTNRPQFKTNTLILPEYFVDGEIRFPTRGKLNAALRDSLRKKKTDLDTFIASINAIIIALPDEACTRQDILEVYETVKTVSPSEISRTTIIAKKKEQAEINAELVRELQEAHRPDVLEEMEKKRMGSQSFLPSFCPVHSNDESSFKATQPNSDTSLHCVKGISVMDDAENTISDERTNVKRDSNGITAKQETPQLPFDENSEA